MEMLTADPPASCSEISDERGLLVGSIDPTRGRWLAQLRVLLEACLAEPSASASNQWPRCWQASRVVPSLRLGDLLGEER